MKYDKFLAFVTLPPDQYELFDQYSSPPGESSLFKSVPLHLVDAMKGIASKVKSRSQRVVVKFRGPRYDAMRCTCLKQHARSAAIYLYQNY